MANSSLYDVYESYAVFDGLLLEVSAANANYQDVFYCNAPVTIKNCILRLHESADYYGNGITLTGAGSSYVINCIAYRGNAAQANSNSITINGAGTFYVYNGTFIGGYNSFRRDGGTVYAKNCYARSNGGSAYQGAITMTTCASSDATGTAGLQTIALNTTNFTNVTATTEDFHLPLGSALIGVATNLYNDATYPFQTDIDGQDRGGAAASWDIGADEYVSSASIEQEGFRFRNDDGSESTATWKDVQDANITLAATTAFRLRMILNATGDPASIGAQLECRYKPSGGAFGSWAKVTS